MATVRQTSFAAGEFARSMHGRTDLALHQHGARRLLNFVVNRQGNAVSRSGTKLIATALGTDVALIPFVTPDLTYVLEIGHGYVRVKHPATGATVIELAGLGSGVDLRAIQWAQVGGSMVLVTGVGPAREILGPPVAPPTALFGPPSWLIRDARFTPPGNELSTAQTLTPVFGRRFGTLMGMPSPLSYSLTRLFVDGAAFPPKEWRWKVSSIMRERVTGEEVETLAVDVEHYFALSPHPLKPAELRDPTKLLALPDDGLVVVHTDRPTDFRFHPTGPTSGHSNWRPVGIVLYRGRGLLFGAVAQTAEAQGMVDDGREPVYTDAPLRGDNPFVFGNWPAAVTYQEQRRIFGRDATMFASAVDDWANFDLPRLAVEGHISPSLEVSFASRRSERIMAMVSGDVLFCLADTSIFVIGSRGVPLGVENGRRTIDEVGAAPRMPLVIDGAVLFVRAGGRGIHAITSGDAGGHSVSDVSWTAEHLFRGTNKGVRSWCHQREPHNAAWIAREDGALLSFTGAGGSWGWARHETSGGRVLSVASAPSGDTDAVFMAVTRAISPPALGVGLGMLGNATQVLIERMTPDVGVAPRYASDPLYDGNAIGALQSSYPLDSHVIGEVNKATGAISFASHTLAHLEGQMVWASCPGIAPLGPLAVVGGTITIPPESWGPEAVNDFTAAFGLAFTCDIELLDADAGSLGQKTIVSVGFEVDNAAGIEIGEDFQHLTPWQQRSVSDAYGFPSGASTLARVFAKGTWNVGGRAVLRQSKPLAVTVLGITRDISTGGK